MRVLVVENMANAHLGQVGAALAERQADIELRQPFAGDALPQEPDDYDALVVLGGDQTALDDHTHPYMPELAALMRRFAESDRAVLGICLGSQLLARGFGAENILGAKLEFGWCDVALTPEGAADPFLSAVPESFSIFQWHSDTFTLPPGAVRLATNAATANQAFRVGRAAYGTQFHFEASSALVEEWNGIFEDQINRMDPDWLASFPEHAARKAAAADAAGLALARAWVALI